MSRLIRTLRPYATLRPTPISASITTTTRPFSSSIPRPLPSSTFDPAPAPLRLPADQQAEFERLQREAEARLNTHTTVAAPPSSPLQTSRHTTSPSPDSSSSTSLPTPPLCSSPDSQASQGLDEVPLASSTEQGEATGGTFSGGIRQGAPPEFEGEVNPKTGEVGGPKNEPLRWGGAGDWSYNGRVTDF